MHQASAGRSGLPGERMSVVEFQAAPFDVIRCDDPRLRVSRPAVAAVGAAVVAEIAGSVDPAVRRVLNDAGDWLLAWGREAASAPLDDVADELLCAWERLRPTERLHAWHPPRPRLPGQLAPPLRPAVHEAVARRLGLRGDPPLPLSACVPGTGIAIERLRQLTLQVRFVATGWVWAPMLDRALDLGREPVDRHEYAGVLHAAGIARRRWYPEAVNALAEMCGREQRVAAYPDLDPARLASTTARFVRRDGLGLAALSEIAAAAADDQQRPVSPAHVSAALAAHGGNLASDGTWAWRTATSRRTPGLFQVARGMLAVAGRLPVPTIHQGWRRRLRGRGVPAEPPVDAVEAVLRAEDAFVVADQPDNGPTVVGLARPQRVDQVYPGRVTALIEAIHNAPAGVLSHRELQEVGVAAGLTAASVSHYLAYHEVFARDGFDSWTLVGGPLGSEQAG